MYVVSLPPPSLRLLVERLWYFEHDFGHEATVPLLPRARPVLSIWLEGTPTLGSTWRPRLQHAPLALCGLTRTPQYELTVAGPVRMVGVELVPFASALVTGLRPAALVDRYTPIDPRDPASLWAGWDHGLQRLRQQERQPEAVLAAVEEQLQRMYERGWNSADRATAESLQKALALFQRAPLRASVPAVARQAGMSTRTLQRRFTSMVGVSPRCWMGMRSVERARQALSRGACTTLDEYAARCGYFDASHFSRSVCAQVGMRPYDLVADADCPSWRMLNYVPERAERRLESWAPSASQAAAPPRQALPRAS